MSVSKVNRETLRDLRGFLVMSIDEILAIC